MFYRAKLLCTRIVLEIIMYKVDDETAALILRYKESMNVEAAMIERARRHMKGEVDWKLKMREYLARR